MRMGRFFIVGGAGFIGSHFTDVLLAKDGVESVTIYDNLSSGRDWHFAKHLGDSKFKFVNGDVKDIEALKRAMDGSEVVIHLASNPDIARAATEPDIDFREGTYLTERVLEAMRLTSAKRILYASGSGVYGDLGMVEAGEDYGPLVPISTYGASKLAGEMLISSYCHMFDVTACVFRFGNVVGPRQTHGVGFDFVRFEQAMFPGDSLYGESEVLETRSSASKPDRGVVHIETRGFNQRGELVIVLRRKFLAPKQ